jgi:hypothetical protein
MMALGHAAGVASALAKEKHLPLRDIPAEALRETLRSQHAEIDWPRPADLVEHLKSNGLR